MSVDYIYWTFTAAAQSISAFVAFLVTGYAIVHNLMESARERDDTLEEIHTALLKSHHDNLTYLAWLTGLAIVLSLIIVYFNRPDTPISMWAQIAVALIDIGAIFGGLLFVISIINPSKYKQAAIKVLEESAKSMSDVTTSGKFFEAFLHLERLIRDYLRNKKLYIPSLSAPRMSFSFRQLIEALHTNEIIDGKFYEELLEINKNRNLVFHGHVLDVDSSLVERTITAANKIKLLK